MVARPLILAAAAALAAVTSIAPAEAANGVEKEAQGLFVEAMKLMGKKRYAEACEKFAQSQELDPGMGTQFRLAECYEKLGRLASAYEQFVAVADAAKGASKPDREAVARKRAADLEVRVAKLTIAIPPAVASLKDLEVRRDGVVVDKASWGTPIPVDPGDHVVTVKAPGKKPWETKVWAEGASKLLVTLSALEDVAPPVVKAPPRSVVPAIVLGAAGGAGVVAGAVFLGLRAGKISQARKLHDKIAERSGTCVGGGAASFVSDCSALASATGTGDTFGTVSLVGFIAGGVSLAGMAVYLLLPEPKPARPGDAGLRITPVLGAGEGGFVASGRF
jgi:hypothetical protein